MLKVLLAEPDEAARRAIRGALEHRGLFVECEAAGAAAIRLGLALRPEVLIAGWRLADDTRGTEVARALQKRDPALRIVVVLPPDPEENWEARCASLRIAAFVRRPIDFPLLREVVESL